MSNSPNNAIDSQDNGLSINHNFTSNNHYRYKTKLIENPIVEAFKINEDKNDDPFTITRRFKLQNPSKRSYLYSKIYLEEGLHCCLWQSAVP